MNIAKINLLLTVLITQLNISLVFAQETTDPSDTGKFIYIEMIDLFNNNNCEDGFFPAYYMMETYISFQEQFSEMLPPVPENSKTVIRDKYEECKSFYTLLGRPVPHNGGSVGVSYELPEYLLAKMLLPESQQQSFIESLTEEQREEINEWTDQNPEQSNALKERMNEIHEKYTGQDNLNPNLRMELLKIESQFTPQQLEVLKNLDSEQLNQIQNQIQD